VSPEKITIGKVRENIDSVGIIYSVEMIVKFKIIL
jgi:hypothetical protein